MRGAAFRGNTVRREAAFPMVAIVGPMRGGMGSGAAHGKG